MPAGFKTCTKVNATQKETNNEQGGSGKSCSHQTAKRPAPRQAAVTKLREEIQRHTAVRNMQMELGRLQEASLRHSGLHVPALNRMHDLKSKILVNDTRITQGR